MTTTKPTRLSASIPSSTAARPSRSSASSIAASVLVSSPPADISIAELLISPLYCLVDEEYSLPSDGSVVPRKRRSADAGDGVAWAVDSAWDDLSSMRRRP